MTRINNKRVKTAKLRQRSDNDWRGIGCFGIVPIIIDGNVKIAIVKHAYGSKKYSLPGGEIKWPGEPADEGTEREIMEETGFTVKTRRELALLSFEERAEGGTIVLFECEIIGGKNNPQNPQEISECRFVSFEEAVELFKQGEMFETQLKLIYIARQCEIGPADARIYRWPLLPPQYYPKRKRKSKKV